jgi:organic hydroperoxide reductase OsmC/OhrA
MATIRRKAQADLTASGKEGHGALTAASRPLSDMFSALFENGTGTDPEALIAQAEKAKKTCSASRALNTEIALAVEFN